MENKKNIAIVISTLRVGGGAERVASIVGNNLASSGHKVTFLIFDYEGDKFPIQTNYFLIDTGEIKNSFGALRALFKRAKKIKKFCQKNNVDHIISFMEEAGFASIISKIFFGNNIKIITSIRNNPEKKKFFSKKLIKYLYSKADKVVANSLGNEEILKRRFGLKNTITIYNLIDYEKIEEAKNEEMDEKYKKLFTGDKTFLNIGRFTEQKGQVYLISAFKKVVEAFGDAKLIIIGQGKERIELRSLINKLDLNKNVFLLEEQKNIFSFMAKSNFFVLSSLWEGMPNVLSEALAVGLPVISTDCDCGPREILAPKDMNKKLDYPFKGENGILISIKNEKDLFQAMVSMIKEGRKKLPKVFSEFKIENIIKQWEEIVL